jgi:hypothetical protein
MTKMMASPRLAIAAFDRALKFHLSPAHVRSESSSQVTACLSFQTEEGARTRSSPEPAPIQL